MAYVEYLETQEALYTLRSLSYYDRSLLDEILRSITLGVGERYKAMYCINRIYEAFFPHISAEGEVNRAIPWESFTEWLSLKREMCGDYGESIIEYNGDIPHPTRQGVALLLIDLGILERTEEETL
mgnify:FL=1